MKKARIVSVLLALLCLLAALSRLGLAQTSASGAWSLTGSMNIPRHFHTAALLPNGKVLVAGGVINSGGYGGYPSTTELYDPQTGTWSTTGSMRSGRLGHTATLLPDGKALVAGGHDGDEVSATAELYDLSTSTWRAASNMNIARFWHTATLLPNGKVLVAGGSNQAGQILSSVELYDPHSDTWSTTNDLATASVWHTATLLPNGKVLVAGGRDSGYGFLSTAQLYDPDTGAWTVTGSMRDARQYHTATLLPNGKVLVVGGDNSANLWATSELYEPNTGTWSSTSNLNIARNSHTATLLPSGKVLVAGGGGGTVFPTLAELYNVSSGTWELAGTMTGSRFDHTATLLSDGRVLVAGGIPSIQLSLSSSELYTPISYGICALYDHARPVKSGSVIPIKLQLCGISGNNLSSSTIVVHALDVSTVSGGVLAPATSPGNANPNNNFRYDPTLGGTGGYIFNLSTRGLGPGTYNLRFIAGNDPTPYTTRFEVR
jgi:hypothetical protein